MDYKTAKQMAESFAALAPDTKLCPFCYWILQKDEEDEWYCPNEMCLYVIET